MCNPHAVISLKYSYELLPAGKFVWSATEHHIPGSLSEKYREEVGVFPGAPVCAPAGRRSAPWKLLWLVQPFVYREGDLCIFKNYFFNSGLCSSYR